MASTHVNGQHPAHEELGGYEGAKLGMWLFLATELLLFGVLFAGFAIFHSIYPKAFLLAHNSLDWKMGGINTLVLIASSFTMAMALDRVQRGKKSQANLMMILTILFAGVFLIIKYFEYTGKFHHFVFPGNMGEKWGWIAEGKYADVVQLVDPKTGKYASVSAIIGDNAHMLNGIRIFWAYYFVMTGIHLLHVLIGMTCIFVLYLKNRAGRYSHWYYTPVENGALYWHLVDLVWIYLFPLLYLIR